MPALTCSHCGTVNSFPDRWQAPGFTCHRCRQLTMTVDLLTANHKCCFEQEVDPDPAIREGRVRRSEGSGSAAIYWILAGMLGVSLWLLDYSLLFGPAGFLMGCICAAHRWYWRGILIVILSGLWTCLGILWSAEAATSSRPLKVADEPVLSFRRSQNT